jgi:hypothetical protein
MALLLEEDARLCAALDGLAEAALLAAERGDDTALARLPRETLLRIQRWRDTATNEPQSLLPALRDGVAACVREPDLPELAVTVNAFSNALVARALPREWCPHEMLALLQAVLALGLRLKQLPHVQTACTSVFIALHMLLYAASNTRTRAEAATLQAVIRSVLGFARTAGGELAVEACSCLSVVIHAPAVREAVRQVGGLKALAAELPAAVDALHDGTNVIATAKDGSEHVSTRAVAAPALPAPRVPLLQDVCLPALEQLVEGTGWDDVGDPEALREDYESATRALMLTLNASCHMPSAAAVDDVLRRYGAEEQPASLTADEVRQWRAGAALLLAFRDTCQTASGLAGAQTDSELLAQKLADCDDVVHAAFATLLMRATWAHLGDFRALDGACTLLLSLDEVAPFLGLGLIQLMLAAAQAHVRYCIATPLLALMVLSNFIFSELGSRAAALVTTRALLETIASGGVRVAVDVLRQCGEDAATMREFCWVGPVRLLTQLGGQRPEARAELRDCGAVALLLDAYCTLPEPSERGRNVSGPSFMSFSPLRLVLDMLADIQPDTTHAELRHLSDVGFDADALAALLRALCKAAEWRDDDNLAHAVDVICAACAPERGRLGLRQELLHAGARVALADAALHACGRPEAVALLMRANIALGPDIGVSTAARSRRGGAAASGSKPLARSVAELAAAEAAADAAMAALLAEEEAEQRPAAAAPGTRKKNRNKKRGGGDASGSGSAATSVAAATLPDDADDVDGGAGALDASPEALADVEEAPPPAPLPPAEHPTLLPPAPPAVVVVAPPAPLAPDVAPPFPVAMPPRAPSPVPPQLPAGDASEMALLRAQLRQMQLDGAAAVAAAAAAAAAAEAALEAERESRLCVVCLDAPKARLLAPCGHACVCGTCADALAARPGGGLCPVCRERIASSSQRFYA